MISNLIRPKILKNSNKSINLLFLTTTLITKRNISIKPNFKKFKLIEQPAGGIIGTVNEAYQPKEIDYYEGSYHWMYDRLITLTLVPLTITPFILGNIEYPILDASLSCLLLWHCKAGFESCIIDYIPKRVYGIWHSIAMGFLSIGTWISLYGIYVIETENNGLLNIITSIWSA